MQNTTLKTQKYRFAKHRGTDLRELSILQGVPEYVLRLVEKKIPKIFCETVIPKYRHD
ncbi:MAG: hypothetical protein ABJC04_02605 [Verrucomicrobiota bacterium]